jgi:hypothetical protein
MFRTAEPFVERGGGFPLGLAQIVHRRFPVGTTRIDDPFAIRHLSDLTGCYGVTYRGDVAERSTGNTFTTMAAELVEAVVTPDTPIELVIVAHATPDLDCRYAATTSLTHALPASSLVFAVSDCGLSTPYTALRLAGNYVRRLDYGGALVLLMDQATLPYDTALAGDAAVAILLRRQCPTGLALRQLAGVRPADMPAALVHALRAVAGADEGVAVIAGAGIDPDRDLPARAEAIWCAPTGYPCTATWEGLARHLGAGAGARVVLIDYDRQAGDLSVCAVGKPWPAPTVRDAA